MVAQAVAEGEHPHLRGGRRGVVRRIECEGAVRAGRGRGAVVDGLDAPDEAQREVVVRFGGGAFAFEVEVVLVVGFVEFEVVAGGEELHVTGGWELDGRVDEGDDGGAGGEEAENGEPPRGEEDDFDGFVLEVA